MAVIIDSNNVTKGGCPVSAHLIIPKTVNDKKDRKYNVLLAMYIFAFLKINDKRTMKKAEACKRAENQKNIDSKTFIYFPSPDR